MFFLRIKRRLVKKSENLKECSTFFIIFLLPVMLKFTVQFTSVHLVYTGPRSAVGNVSGYRCVSDCRSRGREFDPGPVPYFRGD